MNDDQEMDYPTPTGAECIRALLVTVPHCVWNMPKLLQRVTTYLEKESKKASDVRLEVLAWQCCHPLMFPWERLPLIGPVAAKEIRAMIEGNHPCCPEDDHPREEPVPPRVQFAARDGDGQDNDCFQLK